MSWVFYALIAAILTAIVGVIDKMVLSKWMKKPIGSFYIFGIIDFAVGVIALLALGIPHLPLIPFLLALLSGTAFAASSFLYFKALKVDDATRVIPLYTLSPLITAILAATFLGETLAPITYLGILLLSIGAIIFTTKNFRSISIGKGLPWMLLAVLLISIASIISKYQLASFSPWTLFAYSKLGTFFVWVPIAHQGFRAFKEAFQTHGKRVLAFTAVSEGLTSIIGLFFLLAASTGYITLVSAVVSTHPFFLLMFITLLSIFHPKVLKEEWSGPLLARKAAAIVCMVTGAILIS